MDKYWIDALFTKDDIILEGSITKDGLLISMLLKTAEPLLTRYIKTEEGWYWNKSQDRLIAENEGDSLIFANPQLVWENGYEIHT